LFPTRWSPASVALVGAGVVAVMPMAAPPPGLPDVQTRAVKLVDASDPLTEWGTVLQTAEANATDISDHFSAAPSLTASAFLRDPAAVVGPIASILETGQAIAQSIGWDDVGNQLLNLASLF
jgi:hypothetical protein